MGFIYVAVAVLSLLCGGQSAPTNSCESLTRQIDIQGREQLLGKWISVAESINVPGSGLLTTMFVDSSWMKLTAANENNGINVFQKQKSLSQCFGVSYKMTLENNTLSMVKPLNASDVLLNTGCPDCLVVHAKYPLGTNTYRGLQLLSRRNNVTDAQMEEFIKQSQCLDLPQPSFLDPQNSLCPDDPLQETHDSDLTPIMNEMGNDLLKILEGNGDGIKSLIKLLSSSPGVDKGN